MTELIDVGYRDPWDPRDEFPIEKPSPDEYDDRYEFLCGRCGDCWTDRWGSTCPTCGTVPSWP